MSDILPFNSSFKTEMIGVNSGIYTFGGGGSQVSRQVVYWSDKSGKRQIYVSDVDGTNEINLSDQSGFSAANEYEAWISYAGDKITFCSNRHNTSADNYEVFLADIDLGQNPAISNAVKISSIGDSATSNPPDATDAEFNIPRFPSISNSSNGFVLYLTAQDNGALEVYRVSDTTTGVLVSAGTADHHTPYFTSDDTKVYWAKISSTTSSNEIRMADFNPTTLALSGTAALTGGVSGNRSAHINSLDNKIVYEVRGGNMRIADINVNTKVISNNVIFVSASEPSSNISAGFLRPVFSNDNSKVVLQATGGVVPNTDYEVWYKDSDLDATSDSTQVTDNNDQEARGQLWDIKTS